jgi:hypothetical protein
MAFTDEKIFKYPAEDECLVRRLGSGVIAAWPHLPREVQEAIFAEAKVAWDREHFVSKLPDKLTNIIKRRHA